MMKESNYDTGIERTRVPTPSNHETSFVQKAVFLWGLEIARKNAQNAMSPRGGDLLCMPKLPNSGHPILNFWS